MKSFKEYIKLDEGINTYKYKIPKNKKYQLFDFYILTSLPTENITSAVHKADLLLDIAADAQKKIVNHLAKSHLNDVLFSIAAEFRHMLTRNKYEDISIAAKKFGLEKEINKYIFNYKLRQDNLKKVIPRFQAIRTEYDENDARGYLDSYKSILAAFKGKIPKFVKFTEYAFKNLSWASQYGGTAWANISSGWLRLYDASSYKDKVIAIDHIFDLQHNTGTVFTKIQAYADYGKFKWLKDALDKKRNAKSLFDLIYDVSPGLHSFAARFIKAATGQTLEMVYKKSPVDTSIPKQQKKPTSDTWLDNIWDDDSRERESDIWKSGIWLNGTWKKGTWEDGTWKNGVWKSGVWKSGTWMDGTWENGTWYTGTWKAGTWKSGMWKSGFWKKGSWLNGTWESGIWSNGTWQDGTWKKGTWEDGTWLNGTWESGIWSNGTWQDGTWKKGTWEDGTWLNGTWKKGTWKNGTWKNGYWMDGTWENGKWMDGFWYNGTWENGTWENGTWEHGTWENGKWMDGFWYNGTWENGTWEHGTWEHGTWKFGTWKSGAWYDGIWNDGTWKDGRWNDGVWLNGTWESGIWSDGTWKTGLIFDPEKKGNFESDWKWSGKYVQSPISPKEYFK